MRSIVSALFRQSRSAPYRHGRFPSGPFIRGWEGRPFARTSDICAAWDDKDADFHKDEFLKEIAEELAGREPGGGNLQRALAKAQNAWSRIGA
jgi:hypothetical protein